MLTSSLILHALGDTITEDDLLEAFGRVTMIEGGLYITGNSELPTLDFLSRLVYVSVVYLSENLGLVDARLPNLSPQAELILSNNRRLCPGNEPRGSGGCSVIDVEMTVSLSGVSVGEFTALEQLRFANIIDSLLVSTSQVYVKGFSIGASGQLLITFAGVVDVLLSDDLLGVCPSMIRVLSDLMKEMSQLEAQVIVDALNADALAQNLSLIYGDLQFVTAPRRRPSICLSAICHAFG
jgi:hypothetical protein